MASSEPRVSAELARRRLVSGNERFLRGESRFTGMRPKMLSRLAKGQQPYATILGCSDSRVPPELIFDAVLGELFVVRVAGNVLSPEVAGSLQYAGSHLQTPLFVVLGHEGCGAVHAALDSRLRGVRHKSRIQILVDTIVPALAGIGRRMSADARVAAAVAANVQWTVRQIRESPEGRKARKVGRMQVVGAVYELESGRVRFLEDE